MEVTSFTNESSLFDDIWFEGVHAEYIRILCWWGLHRVFVLFVIARRTRILVFLSWKHLAVMLPLPNYLRTLQSESNLRNNASSFNAHFQIPTSNAVQYRVQCELSFQWHVSKVFPSLMLYTIWNYSPGNITVTEYRGASVSTPVPNRQSPSGLLTEVVCDFKHSQETDASTTLRSRQRLYLVRNFKFSATILFVCI